MEGRLAEVVKEAVVVILSCVKTFFIMPCHLQEGKDVWCRNLDRVVESHRFLLLCPPKMAEPRNPQRVISFHMISLAEVINILVSIVVRL